MSTMTISLPAEMKQFIERQTKAKSYASTSEFIRQLVRQELQRIDNEKLERMVLQSIDTGESIPVNDNYVANLKQRVRARIAAGRTRKSRKR